MIGIGIAALVMTASPAAQANHVVGNESEKILLTELIKPVMDARMGKKVFVNKGCVACHAVNGVGGHDAPSMDAHRKMGRVNPFDFAAKMWNHAPGMIAAQEGAFGEQITLTGAEFEGADVDEASFTGANLHGATGLPVNVMEGHM